jgi:hypothetical protein
MSYSEQNGQVKMKSVRDWCKRCQLNSCIAGRCYRCETENGMVPPRKRRSGPRLPKGITREDFQFGLR